jgi:hypothetical protein
MALRHTQVTNDEIERHLENMDEAGWSVQHYSAVAMPDRFTEDDPHARLGSATLHNFIWHKP